MLDDLSICLATAKDLVRIAAIQSAAPEAAHWNAADYLGQSCFVAKTNEVVVGFLVTRETAPGETEILNMAVDPAFRRRGIGRRLLEPILRGEVFLEVRESNTGAQALYISLGFQVAGRRRRYYTDPPEDAIVMRFFS